MLSEPARTGYDLEFGLFGFPIRISVGFWIMALVFGYDLVSNLAQLDFLADSRGPLLILWVGAVFLSILIHELGHAFAMRYCGIHSSVVLYHFGGLAIPTGAFGAGFSKKNLSQAEKIFISAAGPAAQILLAVFVIVIATTMGYRILLLPEFLSSIPMLDEGKQIVSPGLFGLVNFIVWPSVMWAILNLVPVYPLDGGQIAREIASFLGFSVEHSLKLSIATAALMAVWGLMAGQIFLTFLFASLAYSNYQMLGLGGGYRRY